MKKIFFLLLILPVITHAQNEQTLGRSNNVVYVPGMFRIDSAASLFTALDTNSVKAAFPAQRMFGRTAYQNGAFYVHNGSMFIPLGAGGSGASYTFLPPLNESGGIVSINLSAYLQRSDSTIYSTVNRLRDSTSVLRTLISGKQNTLTLTTTGTSGTATLIGSTLNIPTYTTDTNSLRTDIDRNTQAIKDSANSVRAAIPTIPTLYYQHIQNAATSITQRGNLNFSSEFTIVDNSGNASTDIGINAIAQGKVTGLATALAGKVNIADTAGKWITRIYRKAGTDSVFYDKGGTAIFAFRDSTGGSMDTGYIRRQITYKQTGGAWIDTMRIGGANLYTRSDNNYFRISVGTLGDVNNTTIQLADDPNNGQGTISFVPRLGNISMMYWFTENYLTAMCLRRDKLSLGGLFDREATGRLQVTGESATTGTLARFENSAGNSSIVMYNNRKARVYTDTVSNSASGYVIVPVGDDTLAKTRIYFPGINIQAGTSYIITVNDANRIVHMSSTAARTVTLPLAATYPPGVSVWVKDASGVAGANNITVNTTGSDTIDGSATDVINTNYKSRAYYSNGTNWFTLQ